jgi:hypothetical protein
MFFLEAAISPTTRPANYGKQIGSHLQLSLKRKQIGSHLQLSIKKLTGTSPVIFAPFV